MDLPHGAFHECRSMHQHPLVQTLSQDSREDAFTGGTASSISGAMQCNTKIGQTMRMYKYDGVPSLWPWTSVHLLTRGPYSFPEDIPIGLIEGPHIRNESTGKHTVANERGGAVPQLLNLIAPSLVLAR